MRSYKVRHFTILEFANFDHGNGLLARFYLYMVTFIL